MIPQGQAAVLREAAKQDSAKSAGVHLDAIQLLLGETLPALEQEILDATFGPVPLEEAAANLVGAGGKRVRPLACLLVAQTCGAETAKLTPIAAAAELIHSATLLHDDVIDEGEERRNRPASRVLWGNLVSVLSGDLLLTRALQLVDDAGVPGVMGDLLATLERLIAGEVAQLKARNQLDLGVDGYLEIVRGKTASLFGFACRSGARAAGRADLVTAAGSFGEHVGIAYQVVDDVLDLSGDHEHVGKRLGADLAEGKTTLPLAMALQIEPEGIGALLPGARAGEPAAVAAVSRHPAVLQGCEQARVFAASQSRIALDSLGELPEGRGRDLLRGLAHKLTHREG